MRLGAGPVQLRAGPVQLWAGSVRFRADRGGPVRL